MKPRFAFRLRRIVVSTSTWVSDASKKTTTRLVNALLFPPQPTVQQDLVAFAKKSPALRADYNTAEIIYQMQLVGLEELRAVTSFTIEKPFLAEKMKAELVAKKVTPDVIDAITSNLHLNVFQLDGGLCCGRLRWGQDLQGCHHDET